MATLRSDPKLTPEQQKLAEIREILKRVRKRPKGDQLLDEEANALIWEVLDR